MAFELTEENFLIYAIKHYDNPTCKGTSEFHDDLKRFRYIKRLLKKYKSEKDLKDRLLLNHIVVIINLFGPEASPKMLFFKIEKAFWPQLKTFLVFLNHMPDVITKGGVSINESDIPVDPVIVSVLRKI
jgi:hypothetical protein